MSKRCFYSYQPNCNEDCKSECSDHIHQGMRRVGMTVLELIPVLLGIEFDKEDQAKLEETEQIYIKPYMIKLWS